MNNITFKKNDIEKLLLNLDTNPESQKNKDFRYSVSLIYTLNAHSKNIIARDIIYWINAIYGKNIRCHDSPNPPISTNITIIKHEIKKLISPDVTIDIGSISLGKYNTVEEAEIIGNSLIKVLKAKK